MKYKILTVLLIITLTLGSFRINTKAEDGLNDLGLTWNYFSNDNGDYNIAAIYTHEGGNWSGNWSGSIQNNDNPLIIIVLDDDDNILKEFLLEPNLYIIYHTIIDENYKELSIYRDHATYDNLIHSYTYATSNGRHLFIDFIYYTSGIVKDYWDLGLGVSGYEIGNALGYNLGYNDGYEEGVSTTFENGFGGIRNPFTDAFYKDEDSYSYGLGHQEGYEEGLGFDAFGWLKSIIYFIGWILNVQFIPGISLGRIAMLVLFIYLIPFIFRMFGGSD